MQTSEIQEAEQIKSSGKQQEQQEILSNEKENESGGVSQQKSTSSAQFIAAGNISRDFVSALGASNIEDIIEEEDEEDEVNV